MICSVTPGAGVHADPDTKASCCGTNGTQGSLTQVTDLLDSIDLMLEEMRSSREKGALERG